MPNPVLPLPIFPRCQHRVIITYNQSVSVTDYMLIYWNFSIFRNTVNKLVGLVAILNLRNLFYICLYFLSFKDVSNLFFTQSISFDSCSMV